MKPFAAKLQSKWVGPFVVAKIYSHGAVDIPNMDNSNIFKVNGHHLKPLYEGFAPHSVELNNLSEPHYN